MLIWPFDNWVISQRTDTQSTHSRKGVVQWLKTGFVMFWNNFTMNSKEYQCREYTANINYVQDSGVCLWCNKSFFLEIMKWKIVLSNRTKKDGFKSWKKSFKETIYSVIMKKSIWNLISYILIFLVLLVTIRDPAKDMIFIARLESYLIPVFWTITDEKVLSNNSAQIST